MSIRVTPQSTARTVVLEVLPLLGRQVRMRREAWLAAGGLAGGLALGRGPVRLARAGGGVPA